MANSPQLEIKHEKQRKDKNINHGIHGTTRKKELFLQSIFTGLLKETVLLFEDETYAIRGAVFEVYREMGTGFLEAVYQECLEKELHDRAIPFVSQKELKLVYKQHELQQVYRPDIICYGKIIVELKAVKEIKNEHRAQLHNYLKATEYRLGLLVNFGHHPKATIERVIY